MKKLLFLFMLPALVFSQEDIERYKIYPTENTYTSLKLDTATGKIWQLQIGIGDVDRVESVLSDIQWADFKEDLIQSQKSKIEQWKRENPNATPEEIENNAPMSIERYMKIDFDFAQNGRFKLYPTQNMYNFIMQDVISGQSYQVQWNNDEDYRGVMVFW